MKDKWAHLKNKFDPAIIGLLIAISFIFSLIGYLKPRIRLVAFLLYALIIGLLAVYITYIKEDE